MSGHSLLFVAKYTGCARGQRVDAPRRLFNRSGIHSLGIPRAAPLQRGKKLRVRNTREGPRVVAAAPPAATDPSPRPAPRRSPGACPVANARENAGVALDPLPPAPELSLALTFVPAVPQRFFSRAAGRRRLPPGAGFWARGSVFAARPPPPLMVVVVMMARLSFSTGGAVLPRRAAAASLRPGRGVAVKSAATFSSPVRSSSATAGAAAAAAAAAAAVPAAPPAEVWRRGAATGRGLAATAGLAAAVAYAAAPAVLAVRR